MGLFTSRRALPFLVALTCAMQSGSGCSPFEREYHLLDSELVASPPFVDFGAVAVGHSEEFSVELANIGLGRALIFEVGLLAGDPHFEVIGFSETVESGDLGQIILRSTASETGAFSGRLSRFALPRDLNGYFGDIYNI